MKKLRRYRKIANKHVVAVALDLETDGFTYRKWGSNQRCKRGDWLVDNDGDIYTVDGEVFQRTYCKVGCGKYVKLTHVWAEVNSNSGSIQTKEGRSDYLAGDYLVYNDKDRSDPYCVSADKFEGMYELDE